MPNVLVPAWYLRNGRINAAENTLENASSSCERWGIFCAALVVISVIAELVIAFIEPPYNIFLKLSAPTDAAVAIGIVGEVLFGMWDGRIQTELRKRSNRWVEEATERAARLEKEAADARARVAEIEQITAWRHVPEEKREEIAEKLRAIGPSIRLFFEYQNGDIEAFSYLNEIALTFVEAKVGGPYPHTANLWMHEGMLTGASISTAPGIDQDKIVSAFKGGGVEFLIIPWDPLKLFPIPQTEPRPNVRINVYPKPRPSFPVAPKPGATAPATETK